MKSILVRLKLTLIGQGLMGTRLSLAASLMCHYRLLLQLHRVAM